MKSTIVSVSLLLLAATLVIAEEVSLEGVKCVLNANGAAKADHAVDYKGGQVFFCCPNCPKKFDAAKHSTQANTQLVATKQAKQAKCPISGAPCKPEHSVKVANVNVYFCCPNCKGKVAGAEKEKQAELVFANAAFDKAFKVGKSE